MSLTGPKSTSLSGSHTDLHSKVQLHPLIDGESSARIFCDDARSGILVGVPKYQHNITEHFYIITIVTLSNPTRNPELMIASSSESSCAVTSNSK